MVKMYKGLGKAGRLTDALLSFPSRPVPSVNPRYGEGAVDELPIR